MVAGRLLESLAFEILALVCANGLLLQRVRNLPAFPRVRRHHALRTPFLRTQRLRCIALEVHIIELVGENEALGTLAGLQRAELVVLHVLLVNNFGAEINIFQLLLLHLVVLFLSHDANVVLAWVVGARVLCGNIIHGAVERLLIVLALVVEYVVHVDVGEVGVS